jgi:2-phospho-L-lactate guanylyltransferase (CobY/MobA/RfbA family)
MVIAPDRARAGTNALMIDARAGVEFQYGEASFTRHRAWAAKQGWTISTCARTELAFDLDTPADYAAWSGDREEEKWLAPPRDTARPFAMSTLQLEEES